MRNMNSAGAKLSRQRLRECPLGKFSSRKVGELDAAAQCRRGAGDDQGGWVRRRGVYRLEKEGEGSLGKVEEAVSVFE